MVPNIFIITCSEQLTAVTMVPLGRGRSHGGGGAGEGAELGRRNALSTTYTAAAPTTDYLCLLIYKQPLSALTAVRGGGVAALCGTAVDQGPE
ncbi:unnamed protein product [Arctogadus glacialis]